MEKYYSIYKKNEYIIESNNKILLVVIISKNDIEYQQNYGQIIMLLYISYWYNNYNNVNILNVYGIVTSGNNWKYFKCDGIELRKIILNHYQYKLYVIFIETSKIIIKNINKKQKTSISYILKYQ